MAELTILSMGWGVQSWTIAAMVALEELEPFDFGITADTRYEHQATYKFIEQWSPWLEERNVHIVTVCDEEATNNYGSHEHNGTFLPAFTINEQNSRGQLRRQCTDRWKIRPIRRATRQYMEAEGIACKPGTIEQWLGISLDEWQRAKDPDVKYITHRYPLLDMKMTRADCILWLQKHNLPVPPKSGCIF